MKMPSNSWHSYTPYTLSTSRTTLQKRAMQRSATEDCSCAATVLNFSGLMNMMVTGGITGPRLSWGALPVGMKLCDEAPGASKNPMASCACDVSGVKQGALIASCAGSSWMTWMP